MKSIYILSFVFFTAISTFGFANGLNVKSLESNTNTTPRDPGSSYLSFKKVSTPIQTFAIIEEGKERVIFKIRQPSNGQVRIIKIDDNNK